jgi:hypothetical protein
LKKSTFFFFFFHRFQRKNWQTAAENSTTHPLSPGCSDRPRTDVDARERREKETGGTSIRRSRRGEGKWRGRWGGILAGLFVWLTGHQPVVFFS